MTGLTQKIAQNTATQMISKIITTGISVVMLAALTRYLGVEEYGRYSIAFAFVGFMAILADMGLYTVAVREISQGRNEPYVLGNIFSLRVILALFFLCITLVIGYFIPVYSPEVKSGIFIISFSSFFVLIDQIFVGVFQAHLKMHIRAWTEVVARLILLSLVLFFIATGKPLLYFFVAQVISSFLQLLLSYINSRKIVVFRPMWDIPYWKVIAREAVPLGIVIALGMIYFKIDGVMLSLMSTSVSVGIYAAPYKVLEVLIMFPAIFMNSVFPVISRYVHEKDSRLAASMQKSFDFMSIFAFPALVGIVVTAPAIIHLIVGPEFIASATVLRILIFAVFIIFFGTVFGNFVVASGDQKKLVPIYLVSTLLNVGLNLLLIPRYTFIGASIATVLTELCVCLAAFIFLYKKYHFSLSLSVFWRAAFASVIMGIIVFSLNQLPIVALILLATVIYVSLVFLLRIVDRQMIRQIMGRLS